MAYTASVTGKIPKPKKPKGPLLAKQSGTMRGNKNTMTKQLYKSVNKSGNSRNGQLYRAVMSEKGVVHEYEDGTRVLVKKSKKANPTRSYM